MAVQCSEPHVDVGLALREGVVGWGHVTAATLMLTLLSLRAHALQMLLGCVHSRELAPLRLINLACEEEKSIGAMEAEQGSKRAQQANGGL